MSARACADPSRGRVPLPGGRAPRARGCPAQLRGGSLGVIALEQSLWSYGRSGGFARWRAR
eukprot:4849364-Pyramimonas_sp.AAC.1